MAAQPAAAAAAMAGGGLQLGSVLGAAKGLGGLAKGAGGLGGLVGAAKGLAGAGGAGGLGGLMGALKPFGAPGLGAGEGSVAALDQGAVQQAAAAAAAPDAASRAAAAHAAQLQAEEAVREKVREAGGQGFASMLGDVVKRLLSVLKFVKGLRAFLIQLCIMLLAALGVAVILGLFALVVWLLFRVHPRTPLVSNTADFEGWMETYFDELMDLMCSARAGADDAIAQLRCAGAGDVPPDAIGALEDVSAALDALAPRPMLREELERYFKFYHALQSPANYLNKYDLRNDPALLSDGDLDADLHEAFMSAVFEPMEQLRSGLGDASEALRSPAVNDRLPSRAWYTPTAAKLIGDVHMLHLLLNVYFVAKPSKDQGDIYYMYQTRKTGMPMAIWTLYFWPYVRNIFVHRIPNTWKKFPARFVEQIEGATDWWFQQGMALGTLPCKMAYSKPSDRRKYCHTKERFSARKAARRAGEEEEGDEDEVVEPFLGGLKDALNAIKDFVLNIAAVGRAIGKFAQRFPKDPFGSIIGILMLIIGTIVGAVVMLLYILLTVLGVAFLVLFLYAIVMSFGRSILSTVIKVLTVWFIAIPYIVMWVVDMITGGAVVRNMRCENLPTWWEDQAAAENGNVYARFGLLCMAPCRRGFENSGPFCTKKPHYMPTTCAQAQVFRAFRGKSLTTPEALPRYKPTPQFKHMSLKAKQRELTAVWKRKSDFMYACNLHTSRYDFVSRHVCASVDKYRMDEELRARVKGLCAEAYCAYEEVEEKGRKGRIAFASAGSAGRPAFCASPAYDPKQAAGAAPDPAEQAGSVFISALTAAFIALLVLVVFYSLLQSLTRAHMDVLRLLEDD